MNFDVLLDKYHSFISGVPAISIALLLAIPVLILVIKCKNIFLFLVKVPLFVWIMLKRLLALKLILIIFAVLACYLYMDTYHSEKMEKVTTIIRKMLSEKQQYLFVFDDNGLLSGKFAKHLEIELAQSLKHKGIEIVFHSSNDETIKKLNSNYSEKAPGKTIPHPAELFWRSKGLGRTGKCKTVLVYINYDKKEVLLLVSKALIPVQNEIGLQQKRLLRCLDTKALLKGKGELYTPIFEDALLQCVKEIEGLK